MEVSELSKTAQLLLKSVLRRPPETAVEHLTSQPNMCVNVDMAIVMYCLGEEFHHCKAATRSYLGWLEILEPKTAVN